MPDLEGMVRRQRVLADFGDFSLRSENLDEVLAEACRLVAEALGTGRAKVLEIEHGGRTLLVRAGVGWKPDIVGGLRLEMGEHSSETFSIDAGEPIITRDIRTEDRFEVPAFLKDAGVVALANVPIFLPGGRAYGLLQVDATEPRDFGRGDTEFLRTYATILGPVIDRLHKERRLRATEERFRLVVENARDHAILVTDAEGRIADWFPGAEAVFGWTAAEAVGQPGGILFTPEDRAADEDAKEIETARAGGASPTKRHASVRISSRSWDLRASSPNLASAVCWRSRSGCSSCPPTTTLFRRAAREAAPPSLAPTCPPSPQNKTQRNGYKKSMN